MTPSLSSPERAAEQMRKSAQYRLYLGVVMLAVTVLAIFLRAAIGKEVILGDIASSALFSLGIVAARGTSNPRTISKAGGDLNTYRTYLMRKLLLLIPVGIAVYLFVVSLTVDALNLHDYLFTAVVGFAVSSLFIGSLMMAEFMQVNDLLLGLPLLAGLTFLITAPWGWGTVTFLLAGLVALIIGYLYSKKLVGAYDPEEKPLVEPLTMKKKR